MAEYIFFSYSRLDSEFALKLAKDLRAAGANIWVDQLDIKAGVRWDRATQKALDSAGRVLVVLSPVSVDSDNVLDEVHFALEEKKEIVPVLHQPCSIPFRLRRFQYADFTGNYQSGFERLKATLGIMPEAKTTQSALPTPSGKNKLGKTASSPMLSLRSQPKEALSGGEVAKMLKGHNFYCREYDWSKEWANPGGKGISHDYEKQSDGKVVFDRATGLMWEQSGSGRGDYKKAQSYIEKLNSQKFAGYDDWRLPTLEEAMTLMEPEQNNGDLYIDPIFDKTQEWIWTADCYSASLAWGVGFYFGHCLSNPVNVGDLFVRAVRSP